MAKSLVELAMIATAKVYTNTDVSLRIRLDQLGIVREQISNMMNDLRIDIRRSEKATANYLLVNARGEVVPVFDLEMLSVEEASARNLQFHKMDVKLTYVEASRIENNKVVHPPERRSE